ncbi:hypothetical protein AVEN_252909-1 [Araneus ventricosus]|uniref:Uncharacterized protein n=1 Tax=Araneus ventricosus TaxID=182803 RepID=A0A4Y2V824_ARAVE|nr:hypothetical protein AVEN_252909-1 [Araneus ventricosus]
MLHLCFRQYEYLQRSVFLFEEENISHIHSADSRSARPTAPKEFFVIRLQTRNPPIPKPRINCGFAIRTALQQRYIDVFDNISIYKNIFHHLHGRPSGNRRTTPLHLKAEREAVYVRVTRFGKASHLKDQNFDPKDFEGKVPTVKFHLASFELEDRVSFHHILKTDEHINIYTNGCKIDDRTCCAFCVKGNNVSAA